MSLLDNTNGDINLQSLNESELKVIIVEKKKEVNQLNKEIEALKVEIDEAEKEYQVKFDELNQKQEAYLIKLEKQRVKFDKDLRKLELQQKQLKDSYEIEAAEINEKIEAQKLKKKNLLKAKIKSDTATFEKKKQTIENRLKQLRNSKRSSESQFNARMLEIKQEFESISAKQKQQNTDIVDKIDELNVSSARHINELNNQLDEIEKNRVDTLKLIEDAENQKLAEIKRKHDLKIKTKLEELNSVNTQYDSLVKTKNDFQKEFDLTNSQNEKEYNDAINTFETEKNRILSENTKLTEDIEKTQNLINENKTLYDNNIKNLKSELVLYAADREKDIDKIQMEMAAVEPLLKNKYQDFVNKLQQEYDGAKKKNEEDLKALKYNLAQEEKRMSSRNEYLDERYNKRQNLYQSNIQDSNNRIEALKQELDDLNKDYKNKIKDLNNNIEIAKENSEKEIEAKRSEYRQLLKNTESEYKDKLSIINNNITEVKENIGRLNKEIAQSQKDCDTYYNDYLTRKFNLDREHSIYLKDVDDRNVELKKRFENVNNKKLKNDEIYQNNLAQLERQKADMVLEYEQKLTDAQNEYDDQIVILNKKYEDKTIKAQNDHEERLAQINKQFENDVDAANDKFNKIQNKYDNERINLDDELNNIAKQADEKILGLEKQMESLEEMIARLHLEIAVEEQEHLKLLDEIDVEKQQKILQLAKQHEASVEKIIEEYETIPTRQLKQIRDEYALKQVEYNENKTSISSRKHKIDEEEADQIRKNTLQKENADNKFEATNKEYLRFKQEIEESEKILNDDVLKQQNKLADFKVELDQQVQQFKDKKQQELELIEKKNQEELESKKLQYKAAEAVIEKQNEDKIKAHRESLQVKINNLDSLMNEIDSRRESVKTQNEEKYNLAVEKTKEIQRELDNVVNANEIRRGELSNAMAQKRNLIESEIQEVENNYNAILLEKKNSYIQMNNDIKQKSEKLRNEIVELENRKASESSKINTYVEEKQYAIEQLKNDTIDYVKNIAQQIEHITKKNNELQVAHNNRVVFLKEQIASTMTEYDDLLRIKPSLLDDVDKEYEERLLEMTRQFKVSLDELEQTHNGILENLAKTRDETIEKIDKEIEQFELRKGNDLKEFEADVRKISAAYDAMLKDELDKQKILRDQISKAANEQNTFIRNLHNDDLSAISDYENEKQRLAQLHEENLRSSLQEFENNSIEFKKEFEELLAKKTVLSEELEELLDKNQKIDEEIVQEELKLKYQCNTILFEARKLLEQRQNEVKEELDKLDILKG